MDVSLIIVNYNTKNLLADCLHSVYENTKEIRFEVIVVDNNSSDGSEQHIMELFPDVCWIESPENIGFGKANNLGASRASGKYLFLLNSDTILLNNAVKLFFEYAESSEGKHLGAIGAWLQNAKGEICNSYGFFPSVSGEVRYLLGKLKEAQTEQSCVKDVDYIIGADLFINKKLFLEIGGFDPHFFMYYEESDLQLRLALRHWKRRLINSPKIIHLEGGSFGKSALTFTRFIMAQQSYNYFLRKHKHGLKYLWHKFALSVIRLTIFGVKEWTWKEKVKAYQLVLIQ